MELQWVTFQSNNTAHGAKGDDQLCAEKWMQKQRKKRESPATPASAENDGQFFNSSGRAWILVNFYFLPPSATGFTIVHGFAWSPDNDNTENAANRVYPTAGLSIATLSNKAASRTTSRSPPIWFLAFLCPLFPLTQFPHFLWSPVSVRYFLASFSHSRNLRVTPTVSLSF